MAITLQPTECLVQIPGRDKPLRTLTTAVEAGTYGPDAKIVKRGSSATASDEDAKTTATAKKGN